MTTNRLGLVDTLDHLINRGAVVSGKATLSLANIDLVFLQLNLLLSSVETLQQSGDPRDRAILIPDVPGIPGAADDAPRHATKSLAAAVGQPANTGVTTGKELPAQQETKKNEADTPYSKTLTQLVVTLAELLRQLMERQAIRRMEGGNLTNAEVERLGLALRELDSEMKRLRSVFGLNDNDIQIDLGPIGRLL